MAPASGTNVREPAVAGTWYPGDAHALRQTVERLLGEAAATVDPPPGPVLAVVSPHAGYRFSGATAAHAFARVRGAPFRRVVLLGPLHRPIAGVRHSAFTLSTVDAYRTPLGDVPLDRAFIGALSDRLNVTAADRDQEHALEIQLPFLQVALGAFSLVPIMLGGHIAEPRIDAHVTALADALADLADEETLLVASTDLSHLYDRAEVEAIDRRLTDLVAAFDLPALRRALQRDEVNACGATGLVAALEAAKRRGATGAEVLAYSTSGNVAGGARPGVYTVGYMAAVAHA